MANICIYDTGYLKSTNPNGTQLAATLRANSGNLIELKAADFKPVIKANLDNSSVLGTYTDSEVHLVSVENIGFSLSGKLDMDDSADMDLFYALIQCVRTRGYKALFYNVSRDASPNTLNRDKQLVVRLANSHYDIIESQTGISFSLWTGASSVSGKNLTNVYHLHVRFISFDPIQIPGSTLITYSLIGVITK